MYLQASAVLDESHQSMVVDSIKSAIDIGYRHIDCAAIYNIEKFVGKAINDKIAEGVITREDVFITSKV